MNESSLVECYSGTRHAERPLAVHVRGQRLVVKRVLRQWQAPMGPGFDVQVMDGRRFRVQFDEAADRWLVEEQSAPIRDQRS